MFSDPSLHSISESLPDKSPTIMPRKWDQEDPVRILFECAY